MSPRPVPNGPLDMSANARGPLSHSSPTAIIIAWVLTAFVPLPLFLCIIVICYFPKALPEFSLSYICSFWRRRGKHSSYISSSRSASTPSSHTLGVSNTSSYTLPVFNLRPSTPFGQNVDSTDQSNLITPQKPSTDTSRNPTTPSIHKTSPNSARSLRTQGHHPASSYLLNPASESPKSLSFLEPPSISSTPRKSYIRLPANNPRKPSIPSTGGSAPGPCLLKYRRLRQRFLASVVLLIFIVALYVLEGFAVAAAQGYAHVRVLVHANGNGGLGEGKEDEKWLIPWLVYVFFQGALVLFSLWMANSLRRKTRRLAMDCVDEKGNHNERPSEDVSGDIELQALGNEEEKEAFLPTDRHRLEDVHPAEGKGEFAPLDDEEAEEWRKLGFVPTSEFYKKRASHKAHNAELISSNEEATRFVNDNGEGSSSGPSHPAGSSIDGQTDEPGIPVSFLPGAANQWRAERSHAEEKIQRRSSSLRRLEWNSKKDQPAPEDRDALVQDKPAGRPVKDLRSSWEQGDDTKPENVVSSTLVTAKGKGKGKEKETEVPIIVEKEIESQQPEE
ncbi:MAG: hypothetical protein Q9213_007639, partial [Squamulea squamosa]